MFEKVRHGQITFSGDYIPMDESAILLANHRSYIDFCKFSPRIYRLYINKYKYWNIN